MGRFSSLVWLGLALLGASGFAFWAYFGNRDMAGADINLYTGFVLVVLGVGVIILSRRRR